jgi:hypothetical protein
MEKEIEPKKNRERPWKKLSKEAIIPIAKWQAVVNGCNTC